MAFPAPAKKTAVLDDPAAFLAWLATTPLMTAVSEKMQLEQHSYAGAQKQKLGGAPKPVSDAAFADALRSMA